MITQKRLKEILNYDPDTGEFTRAKSLRNQVKKGDPAGSFHHNGYLGIFLENKKYYGHRLAWLWVYGRFPENETDHINGDRADNRISNLRCVDRKENTKNKCIRSDNTSGVNGVCRTPAGKWRVYIGVSGTQKILGAFDDFDLACLVRKEAEHKYNYHENHGRIA